MEPWAFDVPTSDPVFPKKPSNPFTRDMDVDSIVNQFMEKPKRHNYLDNFFSDGFPFTQVKRGRKRQRRESQAQFDRIAYRDFNITQVHDSDNGCSLEKDRQSG